MTLLFHGLWMLCGFGTAVFAAAAVRGWWSIGSAVAGFAIGAASTGPASLPDAVWLSALAGLVAVGALAWPRQWGSTLAASASAGALAGVWSALFQTQGLPALPALALAAMVPAVAAWLAVRRPAFAPPVLRDEGLLAVIVLGLAVAVTPGVVEGWRAALNLALEARSTTTSVPAWTTALSAAAFAVGGVYTLWSRR